MSLLVEFLIWLPVAVAVSAAVFTFGWWVHATSGCHSRDWWKQ